MKLQLLFLLSAVLLCGSCKKNNEDGFYNATVLATGNDCGTVVNTLIRTDKPITAISGTETTFNAVNLPEEYQVEGKRVKIKATEYSVPQKPCLALYIMYLHIKITDIKSR